MEIEIERTKKGYPALWEKGGGYSNTGSAVIVCGEHGEQKKAIYIRGRGDLACGRHALVIIQGGDHVIMADHHRRDFSIRIYKITKIEGNIATLAQQGEYSQGEWDLEPPAYLADAIEAAKEKATCYHCREPHYVEE